MLQKNYFALNGFDLNLISCITIHLSKKTTLVDCSFYCFCLMSGKLSKYWSVELYIVIKFCLKTHCFALRIKITSYYYCSCLVIQHSISIIHTCVVFIEPFFVVLICCTCVFLVLLLSNTSDMFLHTFLTYLAFCVLSCKRHDPWLKSIITVLLIHASYIIFCVEVRCQMSSSDRSLHTITVI